MGVAVVLLANVFFGGGKCPNLGVVNVRLANNLTPRAHLRYTKEILTLEGGTGWYLVVLGQYGAVLVYI